MADDSDRPKGQTISVTQAAVLLNRTGRWVQNLVAGGFIAKSKRGQYSLVEVVRGALAYYESQLEKSTKAAAASRVTDARTRLIEINIAERQRELIPVEDAKAAMGEFAACVRTELTGLPARLTRNASERRKLEQEVDATLRRLSAQAGKSAVAMETGASDPAAGGEEVAGVVGSDQQDVPAKRRKARAS